MMDDAIQIVVDEMVDIFLAVDDHTPENIVGNRASFMALRETLDKIAYGVHDKKNVILNSINSSLEIKKDKIFKLITGSEYV